MPAKAFIDTNIVIYALGLWESTGFNFKKGCRWLSSSKTTERKRNATQRWFLGMHLLSQSKNSISALELKRHLGVRYKTAWLLKHKLMQVMTMREE